MPTTRYYAVHVSNRATSRRGTAWVWSPPYDAPGDARRAAKEAVRSGDATLAFLVAIGDEGRSVRETYPPSADGIVRHYLDLTDAIKREGER